MHLDSGGGGGGGGLDAAGPADASNFMDGYAADLTLTRYLRADFTASRQPNDPDNVAPPGGAGSDGGT